MKAHALALFTILVWSTTFVAALVWSVYSTLVDRIADAGYETLAATKRIFAWGLLFMMPAVPFAGAFPALGLVDPLVVANLLFLGLGASAACFATWNFAVKHLGAVATSTYIYLVPALTGAASALVLGEPVPLPSSPASPSPSPASCFRTARRAPANFTVQHPPRSPTKRFCAGNCDRENLTTTAMGSAFCVHGVFPGHMLF